MLIYRKINPKIKMKLKTINKCNRKIFNKLMIMGLKPNEFIYLI